MVLVLVTYVFHFAQKEYYEAKKLVSDYKIYEASSAVTMVGLEMQIENSLFMFNSQAIYKKIVAKFNLPEAAQQGKYSYFEDDESSGILEPIDYWDFPIQHSVERKATLDELEQYFNKQIYGWIDYWQAWRGTKIAGIYLSRFLSAVSFGLFPLLFSLAAKFSTIKVFGVLLIMLVVLISTSKLFAQDKTIIKYNTKSDGGENKSSIAILHLRPKTGILFLQPSNGVMLGAGPNFNIDRPNVKGMIFTPLSATLSNGENGATITELRLWSVAGLKFGSKGKLSYGNKSFACQPINDSPRNSFMQNQFCYQVGSWEIGLRRVDNFKAGIEPTHEWGPVLNKIMGKLSALFYYNVTSPHSYQTELSFSF
jgi:hypothetical protein